MKRLFSSILGTLLVLTGVTPVFAGIGNYQESPRDSYTRPGTPSNFDVTAVSYGEFSDAPDFHYFFIDFASAVKGGQFNDGLGSWAMIMIDVNGDEVDDYQIATLNETLVSGYGSPAAVWDVRLDREVTGCSPQFYGNLDEAAQWVGFKVPYNCLKLPRTFGIRAYADYIEDDDAAFDYAPDTTYFKVSHKLTPTTKPTLSLPKLQAEALSAVGSPGNPPSDLVALSPQVLKSVVTVFCGEGLGTGWAAKVAIPAVISSQGLKSFVITNHHVVEDCIGSGEVTLTTSNGNSAIGYIAAVDSTNDLAGIYSSLDLPMLSFRGEKPAQGWWVGVLGTPRGLDGYLTTGLVSKVASDGSELGVSAPLNPGNSGGPIFDRMGRVIGVATYKLLDSEGLGFAGSAPLLCKKIVSCDSKLPVWSTQLVGNATEPTTPGLVDRRVKSSLIASFSGSSSKLSTTQTNSINKLLIQNSWAKKFICTGVVSSKATKQQLLLARTRAKNACSYAKTQNPGLSTFYQTKVSTSRSSIGKVLVTLKP